MDVAAELRSLRAENEDLRRRLDALEGRAPAARDGEARSQTRRQLLLTMAGGAAGLATGTVLGSASPAAAAATALLMDTVNTSTITTELRRAPGAGPVLLVKEGTGASTVGSGGILVGAGNGPTRPGVAGYVGTRQGSSPDLSDELGGVVGRAFGSGSGVVGVADADSEAGVKAISRSSNGFGLLASALEPGGEGANISGHSLGALIESAAVDRPPLALAGGPCQSPVDFVAGSWAGALYIESDGGGGGSPAQLWFATDPSGGWRRMAGPSTAGALTVLPTPVRCYDSRAGFVPFGGQKGQLAANVPRSIDTKVNSTGVAHKARAVVANLTVTGGATGGFLVAYPDGTPPPNASSINWSPGQSIANAITIGLGPNERIAVRSSAPVDVIIDVIGYHL